jgi:hypothetical protein
MQQSIRILILILASVLVACAEQSLPVFDNPMPISVPSGSPAYGPRLSESAEGVTTLSWMERKDDGNVLRYSSFEEGSWSPASTVINDEKMFVSWADLPAVTPLGGSSLLAHWMSYTADSAYAFQVLTSRSDDDGVTWTAPASPHNDDTPTEHGFVSIYPTNSASGLVWLDGRNTPNKAMTLRSAILAPDGVPSDEAVVDDQVCDCCQTDVALTNAGPVVVYRNRTEDEVRDIYVARQLAGEWQPGQPIANDGWVISGCPVNGPAIDAAGDLVVVAWFTGANQTPKVQAAISTNAGKTFSKAMEISSTNAAGHVGIALIDAHSFAVSWMESGASGEFTVNLRALTTNGAIGPVRIIGRTSVAQNVPQLLRVRDKLLLAWTDEFDGLGKVVSVEVAIRGFYD